MKSQNFQDKSLVIGDVQLKVMSYQVGDKFYCNISNLDPGATIARAEGRSEEEAYETAVAKVKARL